MSYPMIYMSNWKLYLSRLMGKPTICIGENKGADQLRGNREADQRLCFRYSNSTIPLLLKSEISRFYLFSVLVQAGLCRTCSETTLLVFPRGGSIMSNRKLHLSNPRDNMGWSVEEKRFIIVFQFSISFQICIFPDKFV